jgi:hypothetical protein
MANFRNKTTAKTARGADLAWRMAKICVAYKIVIGVSFVAFV